MWWPRRYDAFISYSHKDNEVVKPLVELLSVNQHRVFWDQNLKAGDRWDAAIRSSIEHSGIFVLFWCCDTCESGYIAGELALAIRLKKKIVPVKLCAAAMPPALGDWQWIDLRQRVQHLCTDVDHQHTGDGFIVSGPLLTPRASKKWLVPVAAAAALLLLSGVFISQRMSRHSLANLPAPVSNEYRPAPPPPGSSAISRGGQYRPSVAPEWYTDPAVIFLAISLVAAMALFVGMSAVRQKRASRALRLTMDYLHRLQRGN